VGGGIRGKVKGQRILLATAILNRPHYVTSGEGKNKGCPKSSANQSIPRNSPAKLTLFRPAVDRPSLSLHPQPAVRKSQKVKSFRMFFPVVNRKIEHPAIWETWKIGQIFSRNESNIKAF
jgi:hypothetical protein